MAANLRLTGKTVAPFFNPPNLSHSADTGQRRATNHAERVDAVCRLSNICEQWAFAARSSTAAVTNVANFGAFVDIAVHQDGLLHVSQLAERFVVEMPAGIVLAVSGEHNDALLRRGPWTGSKEEEIPSAWRRRTAHES